MDVLIFPFDRSVNLRRVHKSNLLICCSSDVYLFAVVARPTFLFHIIDTTPTYGYDSSAFCKLASDGEADWSIKTERNLIFLVDP